MAGENIDRPTSASVPLVEAGARVGVVQRLGRRVFVSAHADGLVEPDRWTGSLDQVPVWTAPRFAAALGVDVGVPLSVATARYGAVTTACVPSYLTTWSGVAVTPMPLP